jgi:hypothetical protein
VRDADGRRRYGDTPEPAPNMLLHLAIRKVLDDAVDKMRADVAAALCYCEDPDTYGHESICQGERFRRMP